MMQESRTFRHGTFNETQNLCIYVKDIAKPHQLQYLPGITITFGYANIFSAYVKKETK